MTESHWQVQDAKQRFSELIRHAQSSGAQFVTRHGAEVAVVLDIAEYRRLRGQTLDFKEYLLQGPHSDDLVLERAPDLARATELPDSE
jgi:prevent-host-death family protein